MSTLFKTFVNFREEEIQGEVNTEPSMTQPDEVLSIRQMLERHVRGLPLHGEKQQGQYYPPELGYVPNIAELDLAEIDDYRSHYRQLVKDLTAQEKQVKSQVSLNSQTSGEADKPQTSDGQSQTSDSDVES